MHPGVLRRASVEAARFIGTFAVWLFYYHSIQHYPRNWQVTSDLAGIAAVSGFLLFPRQWRSTWRESILWIGIAVAVAVGMIYPTLRFSLGWV
ncbi:MAG: hypothetical protein ACOY93_08425 [Bacillota bacterium]